MTIEDRVRRVLTEAVADEPPLRGAPLERALRRRRPLLTGAVALTLVLAVVGVLVAVRGLGERPLPSTVSTKGWKTYTDTAGNLRLRYPPDWRLDLQEPVRLGRRGAILIPPELANRAGERPGFTVSVEAFPDFWIGEDWFGTTSMGRLPGGQSYLRTASDPTDTSGWGQPPPPDVADRPRHATWSIDWGRPCLTGDARCVPHSVRFTILAGDGQLWERYGKVAETIPTTVEQLRPTKPSVGDRGLPACRPDQWRLIWPEEYGSAHGRQTTVIQGGVQHRQGPRCHLRLTVRMAVQDDRGRLLPVRGNPASTTVEGDLPLDGMQFLHGSWVIGGALMWHFIWDEWCNRGLPKATLRVTADGGASLTVPGLDPTPRQPQPGMPTCRDRGRPSIVAGWPR
jgi:hypothetical protein